MSQSLESIDYLFNTSMMYFSLTRFNLLFNVSSFVFFFRAQYKRSKIFIIHYFRVVVFYCDMTNSTAEKLIFQNVVVCM